MSWDSLDEVAQILSHHLVNISLWFPHLSGLQTVFDHPHGEKYSPNKIWLENHFLGAQKIIES